MILTILINGLWQGALIVGVAALITALQPPRSAATRYAIWFCALLALALVPVASIYHPATAFTILAPAMINQATAGIATTSTSVTATVANTGGPWLLIFWIAGAMVGLVRLAVSYVRINRIVRFAVPAPHLGREIATSHQVSTPITTGLFSPMIVIPEKIAQTLERSDLERIISHERAHVRRRDFAANLVQRIIVAFLFFNPWAYIIGAQLVGEREAACDDWAVLTVDEAEKYASCLAELAQNARGSRIPLLTPSVIGPGNLLVHRIGRLLSGKAAQLKINSYALATSVAIFAALAIVLQTSGIASPSSVVAVAAAQATCDRAVQILDAAAPAVPAAGFRSGSKAAAALVTVSADGRPLHATIFSSSGNATIDSAVTDAAMRSTYAPKLSHCKATAGVFPFRIELTP